MMGRPTAVAQGAGGVLGAFRWGRPQPAHRRACRRSDDGLGRRVHRRPLPSCPPPSRPPLFIGHAAPGATATVHPGPRVGVPYGKNRPSRGSACAGRGTGRFLAVGRGAAACLDETGKVGCYCDRRHQLDRSHHCWAVGHGREGPRAGVRRVSVRAAQGGGG